MRRLVLLAVTAFPVVAAYIWLGGGSVLTPALGPPARPVLPDLVVAPLSDLTLARRDDGTREIFFTATVANIGDGPFVVHARRARNAAQWLVTQRFVEPDGGRTERPIRAANLTWGGHGHNHWHVELGVSYRLVTRDEKELTRKIVKAGFCFFDQKPYRLALRRAPTKAVHPARACSGSGTSELEMGLSVGWSDPYSWLLPDQRIDVTRLPYGKYRLVARADPDGWFRETDETNNITWVDIDIREREDGIPVLEVIARS